MTRPYRLTDAETEDLKVTVLTLAETIRSIAMTQGWSHQPVEQWVEIFAGVEAEEHVPAVRRTFLLLEER